MCNIKGTLLSLLEDWCAAVAKKYWALKREEILKLTISPCLVFSNYVILGGHILNIFKMIFTKLIFHLRFCDELPHVVFL